MYKIGQRVKKVRGDFNIGNTGIVVGNVPFKKGDMTSQGTVVMRDCDMQVRMDQATSNIIHGKRCNWPPGVVGYCRTHEWEPIVDDGAKPSRYSAEELFEKFGINIEESKALITIPQQKEKQHA